MRGRGRGTPTSGGKCRQGEGQGTREECPGLYREACTCIAYVYVYSQSPHPHPAPAGRLTETSALFNHTSRNLHRKYCYKNVKVGGASSLWGGHHLMCTLSSLWPHPHLQLWILLIAIITFILVTLIGECTPSPPPHTHCWWGSVRLIHPSTNQTCSLLTHTS